MGQKNYTEINFDDLLNRLDHVTGEGNRRMALCPAHDDTNPSLSIKREDDCRALVHCFAGCKYEKIMQAMGLRRERPEDVPLKRWLYTFGDGRTSYHYRRDYDGSCPSKHCSNKRRHKHVWWDPKTGSLEGVKALRIDPEGATAGDVLVVTEGEKDAEAVAVVGYVAYAYPCDPGNVDFADLAYRDVVVWADNDEPGRKYAKKIVAKLKGIAQSVRAIGLDRDGKDGAGAADVEIDERRAIIEAAESAEGLSAEIRTNPEATATTEFTDRTMIRPDKTGMVEVLKAAGLEIRRNSRSLDFEVRGIGGQPAKRSSGEATQPDGWTSLTDDIWAAINQVSYTDFGFRKPVTETRSPARWLQRDMKEAFLNLCPEPVDPFIEWLESLPAWDGEPRIHRLWIDTLGMPDDELSNEGARRFLIGAIRRAYEPGAVHDWMLVLVGPQGLGKSSVLRELVSPSPFWHTDGVTLDGTKRELFESIGPAVLAEFSEMGGLERHNQRQFKAWLTRNYDRVRPAYARIPLNIQRRFVPVGTANPSHRGVIPHDPTGARRYLLLESTFTGKPNELKAYAAKARAWVQEWLNQLWAEAVHDYIAAVDRGEQDMNLIPAHLVTSQQDRAVGYTQEDESMANLAEDLKEYGREYEEQKKFGPELTELMVQGKLANDKTEALRLSREKRKLGDALAAAGWNKKKRRYDAKVQTRWFAPPLDYPADQDGPPPMTNS